MNKLKMRPIGGCISPVSDVDTVCSSHNNISKYIQWVPKNYTIEVDIEFYIDDGIISGLQVEKRKYGWLLESRPYIQKYIDIITSNIDLFKLHYEFIFTCQLDLVKLGAPFVYSISNAAPWVNIENRKMHEKNGLVSMLVSNSSQMQGHVFRLNYMNQNKALLDVYGRGHKYVENTEEAFMNYMFTVSMENDVNDNYFTERLTSPMSTYTIPIYRGSKSVVEKYFNPKGVLWAEEIDLKDLNKGLYNSMKPYMEENYKIACNWQVADDYIVENYFL